MSELLQPVLAIDTSSRGQSISVFCDGVATNRSERVGHDHGVVLLRNISRTLEDVGIQTGDLKLVAVGTGPGTFTGLRVGLATAKAVARAISIPLVGISSLRARAFGYAQKDLEVVAVTDARRSEVYVGAFRYVSDSWEATLSEGAFSPHRAMEMILDRAEHGRVLVVGNGPAAYPDVFEALPPEMRLPESADERSIAESVALIGYQRAQGGAVDDIVMLEPNYIRPSDAKVPKPFAVRKNE